MFKLLLPVLLLTSCAGVFASTTAPIGGCGSATLSSYESSYPFPQSNGCSIGILDYSNFKYIQDSNAPAASDIFLTPTGQGFNFTQTNGTPFVATAGETVQFEIDYNILIDPAPVIAGADNRLDPPTGNVLVTEYFCNDLQYFSVGTCFGGTPQSLSVGTPVTNYPYSASITFNPPAYTFQEVGILFTLTGPASFDGFSATTQVVTPEPASMMLVGLFMLAGGYKLRKQRQH